MTHIFWLTVIALTLLWYIVVMILVAVRGARDIRSLFEDQNEGKNEAVD